MADRELIVTLPAEAAAIVEEAVATGEFASDGEMVGVALREWHANRATEPDDTDLRVAIAAGLADLAAGRTVAFDADRIAERGRQQLASRSISS